MAFAVKMGKILGSTSADCLAGSFTAGLGVGYVYCQRQDLKYFDVVVKASKANLMASEILLKGFKDLKDQLPQAGVEHKQMEKELEARRELTANALEANKGDCGYLDEF